MSKEVFCLMGPTASGKTSLACQLSKHFPFEIISVDSAMIYKEMNIGTAKPTFEELNQTPHHLIDIIDPIDTYSAAQFCDDVHGLIDSIYQRGKLPLLVGGTMMYFNALQQGLSLLPNADEKIRHGILEQAKDYGWAYLHDQLKEIDALSAEKIHPHDTQRIQRALEVYQITGKPLSVLSSNPKPEKNYRFVNIILFPQSRDWLHHRIAVRFEMMLANDFVSEVAQLLQKWQLPSTCPSMRSVGYRQVIHYLAGDYDYQTLCHKGIVATRQLAKRQLTWLRQWPDGIFFECDDEVKTTHQIIALLNKILHNEKPSNGHGSHLSHDFEE